MDIQPIVLAAGKGTRMGNPDLPKVLTPLQGRPLVSYLLHTLGRCFPRPAAIVVGYRQELVKEALGNGYTYIEQRELKGTGDAVRSCQAQLAGTADAFLVMNGDHPLFSASTIKNLAGLHASSGAVLSLLTLKTNKESFYNFGRILRGSEGQIEAIREYKDCTSEEAAIQEYNVGLYCFSDAWLWTALERLAPLNAQHEYYLTDLLAIALKEGHPVSALAAEEWQEALGVNTPEQLAEVEAQLGKVGT